MHYLIGTPSHSTKPCYLAILSLPSPELPAGVWTLQPAESIPRSIRDRAQQIVSSSCPVAYMDTVSECRLCGDPIPLGMRLCLAEDCRDRAEVQKRRKRNSKRRTS